MTEKLARLATAPPIVQELVSVLRENLGDPCGQIEGIDELLQRHGYPTTEDLLEDQAEQGDRP